MRRNWQHEVAEISARLPDVSLLPLRKQIGVAVVASVLLHLLFFSLFEGITFVLPEQQPAVDFAATKPAVQELEVEVQIMPPPTPPPPEPAPFTLAAQERSYIDSAGLAKSELAPENAMFEADQNMVAASELPATGSLPLPSQMGADRTFTNFKTQNVLIGKTAQPFPTDVSLANAPAAAAAPPTPIYKPQPVSPSNPAPAELAKAEPPPPPPRPTPVPLKTTPASADEIPLEVPKPATPPPKPPPPDPEPEPEPQQQRPKFAESKMAMITTPRPQPKQPQEKPGASGFQPHLEQTKIEGAISNRGRPAVDSVRTPLAVYKKHISEAIGSRWYYYIKAQMDLITVGTVTISFAITADGRVQDVRVVSNTGNASLANVCEQSVREAEIAPPPPDVVENMRDGRMELPFTFTFYDTH